MSQSEVKTQKGNKEYLQSSSYQTAATHSGVSPKGIQDEKTQDMAPDT